MADQILDHSELSEADANIIDQLLLRLNLKQLDKLIDEINEEKELRKLKNKRLMRLKDEFQKEKQKMILVLRDEKQKILRNLEADSHYYDDFGNDYDDEEEDPKKMKIIKKPKKVISKK